MVRLSIYNEKGGVGKTTITALLSSYLAYACGKRVCALDFDYPSFHLLNLRHRETALLENPRSPLAVWMGTSPQAASPYDLFSVAPGPSGTYSPLGVLGYLDGVLSGDYDYVIYDFPGRFTPEEPVSYIAANGLLDFVGIPMDTDTQSRRSALVVADSLKREGVVVSLFWNRVSSCEAKGDGSRFVKGAAPFLERGFDVMEHSLRDIRKISRDSSEITFIRSTLCFPERYVNRWSPAIIPFLEALKQRADRCPRI